MNIDLEICSLKGPLVIEVFTEAGGYRAVKHVDSICKAFAWLDITPICRTLEERLMIRIEDKGHSGFWIYVGAPHDESSDWISGEAAERLRARIGQRAVK